MTPDEAFQALYELFSKPLPMPRRVVPMDEFVRRIGEVSLPESVLSAIGCVSNNRQKVGGANAGRLSGRDAQALF